MVKNSSFFVVESSAEDESKKFKTNDPIYKAGICDVITISLFNKKVDDLSIRMK